MSGESGGWTCPKDLEVYFSDAGGRDSVQERPDVKQSEMYALLAKFQITAVQDAKMAWKAGKRAARDYVRNTKVMRAVVSYREEEAACVKVYYKFDAEAHS